MLKQRLVPELIQDELKPEVIAKLAIELLENLETRSLMIEGYERLRRQLGQPGVTNRAASEILDLIQK